MLKETARQTVEYEGKKATLVDYAFGGWKFVILHFGKEFPPGYRYEIGFGRVTSNSSRVLRRINGIVHGDPIAKVLKELERPLIRSVDANRKVLPVDTTKDTGMKPRTVRFGQPDCRDGAELICGGSSISINLTTIPYREYPIADVGIIPRQSYLDQATQIMQSIVNDYFATVEAD